MPTASCGADLLGMADAEESGHTQEGATWPAHSYSHFELTGKASFLPPSRGRWQTITQLFREHSNLMQITIGRSYRAFFSCQMLTQTFTNTSSIFMTRRPGLVFCLRKSTLYIAACNRIAYTTYGLLDKITQRPLRSKHRSL